MLGHWLMALPWQSAPGKARLIFNTESCLNAKKNLAIAHDLAAVALCWYFAYYLRFNLNLPETFLSGANAALPFVFCVYVPVCWFFGLYRGIWRYASVMDLRRIIVSVGLSALLVASGVSTLGLKAVPRSVLILHPILLVMLMGGSRFLYRAWRDQALYGRLVMQGEPVIILGTKSAADHLLRELMLSPAWGVVGLLTNESSRVGNELQGVKILGLIETLPEWASRLSVGKVIVAMPEATLANRRRAIEVAVNAGLSVMTVPSMDDILTGKVAVSQVRSVQLEDLLGRDPVQLDDRRLQSWLGDQTILVTGAGGSIGSELVRQIARFRPRRLLLLEVSEFALYKLEQEFLLERPETPITCIVGDIKDEGLLDRLFAKYAPSVVFHAAAYKHVPLMENENAWQAIQNNVAGSMRLALSAQRYGIDKVVLISTDKAVNPTNVMGATKRLAERVLAVLQARGKTRFVTVRFGNVLGSNGSVIPKFSEQIARGGPVTVTHPEIIRYFMLIPEAAQLVLQAGMMGCGGEIFVLDMGEPIPIVNLARDMIRLSGFSEDEIRIEYTGLRPGEKLYEELLTDNEKTLPTPHAKLRVAQSEQAPEPVWFAELEAWLHGPIPETTLELKQKLKRFVPEYSPQ